MTGVNENHLTQNQLDDALMGDLARGPAAHLTACSACQQQLAEARLPMDSFKMVTLAWSERRSATLPASLQERMLHNAAGSKRRAWMTAAAAVLALVIAIPYGIQRGGHSSAPHDEAAQSENTNGVVVTEANAEQIARDNQMLNEIDLELDSNRTRSEAMELQGEGESPVPGQTIQD